MSQPLLLLLILAATLLLLVTQWVRIEVTSLAVVVTLALTGLLGPDEALSGFSSSATLTVAAMLVLSAGLDKSGAVDSLARRLQHLGQRVDGAQRVGYVGHSQQPGARPQQCIELVQQ